MSPCPNPVDLHGLDRFDEFEEQGAFWIPGKPETRIGGVLKYEPGKLPKMVPHPNEYLSTWADLAADSPTIVGELAGRQPVTLLGALVKRRGGTSLGPHIAVVSDSVVEGRQFASEAEIEPASCRIETTGLNDWFAYQHFRGPHPDSRPLVVRTGHESDWRFEFRVEAIDATISSAVREETALFCRDYVRYGHRMGLRLDAKRPRRLAWHDKQAFRLRNLLTLLIGKPAELQRVELHGPEEQHPDGGVFRPSFGYFRPPWLIPKELAFDWPAFDYPRVRDRFPEIVERWFAHCEKGDDAVNLFFASEALGRGPIEAAFIASMQALEGVLRVEGEGSRYVPAPAYEEILSAVVAAIPSGTPNDLRASLITTLGYGNEPSQRRRIRHAFKPLSEATKEFLIGKEKPAEFTNHIIDGRNYLTHLDPAARMQRLTAPQLSVATSKVRSLTAIILLRTLGLDNAEIVDRLRETSSFAPVRESRLFRRSSAGQTAKK